MRVCVARALRCAGVTGLGAQPAQPRGLCAVAGHQDCGQATEVGAVMVQADAGGHGRNIMLGQASGGAVLTSQCTGIAGLDAGGLVWRGHGLILVTGTGTAVDRPLWRLFWTPDERVFGSPNGRVRGLCQMLYDRRRSDRPVP